MGDGKITKYISPKSIVRKLANALGVVINPATEGTLLTLATESTLNDVLLETQDISAQQTDKSQMTQITNGTIESDVVANIDKDTDIDGLNGLVTAAAGFGRVNDTTLKNIRIDAATEASIQLSYEHHEIHAGSHFFICDTQSLANGAAVDFTIVTPNTTEWTHLIFVIEGTGAISLEIFEGATVNVAGAAVLSYNNNRNSANTTSNTIRVGDTFTATGTSIYHVQTGANKVAGVVERSRELVLDQNNTYLFRITNQTALANQLSYCAEWYEHTDRN